MDRDKRNFLKTTLGAATAWSAAGLGTRSTLAQTSLAQTSLAQTSPSQGALDHENSMDGDLATGGLSGDHYPTSGGQRITIRPLFHASLALELAGTIIYVDPVEPDDGFKHLPPPDVILITHEHQDHFNVPALGSLMGTQTRLITNSAVAAKLPPDLAEKAQIMQNGQSLALTGFTLQAVPAYNRTSDRVQFHPKGRDNGYVLDVQGARVYIAGDTEDIPEMSSLTNILVAFLPMNLPFTMSVEQAANAVGMFAPRYVYPYHYRGSNIDLFERMVSATNVNTQVVRRNWYPET